MTPEMLMKYIGDFDATLRDDKGEVITSLLWGDPLQIVDISGSRVHVKARGKEGWLPMSCISSKSLLEIYIIDVGQGDSVLMKTPDEKWHIIDAGAPSATKGTGKGAANFLRWKFEEDLGLKTIRIANMILTHPDLDHYGGFFDILAGRLSDGRRFGIEIENFYHSGLACFAGTSGLGRTVKGKAGEFPAGPHGIRRAGEFVVGMVDGAESFRQPEQPFDDEYAKLADLIARIPRNVRRISSKDGYLPGYKPGETDVSIRALGPVMEVLEDGQEGLRILGKESVTRNGHSTVLRVDYGQARILLNGDLNSRSQLLLQSYHPGSEFLVDVTKGCHHGSEDIDIGFVKAMGARATVISSGDNESYSHPRPLAMGASARYGRESVGLKNEPIPPLIYSTELARSVTLAKPEEVRVDIGPGNKPVVGPEKAEVRPAGARTKYRRLNRTLISTDLIYGLVNVRTDGTHILCATMRETGSDFDVKIFRAGVSPDSV